jgi:hypothetical protein
MEVNLMEELHLFVGDMINKLIEESMDMIRNFDTIMSGKTEAERARILGRFDEKNDLLQFLFDKDRELIIKEAEENRNLCRI